MATSSCAAIVENVFRRSGSLKRLRGELSVYYWPQIAGSQIAKNVKAVRYSNGYLYLKTDSSTLAHQLTMMQVDIVKRYRRVLGPEILKGVRIKVGTIERNNELDQETDLPELDETEKAFIETNCQNIQDDELAQRFKRLMQKSYQVKHRMHAQGAHQCLSCNVVIDQSHSYCPVCEIKIKEEMASYVNYLKKNNKEIQLSDLAWGIGEANEHLIRKMLNF